MNLKQVSTTAQRGKTMPTVGPQLNQSTINNNYELNNTFYIIIVLILNLFSILNIIFKLKYLIELSEEDEMDVYTIAKHFYVVIINLTLIILLTIVFLRYSLLNARSNNLSFNDNQLGSDLIIIYPDNESLFKTQTSSAATTPLPTPSEYFPASSLVQSTSSSSSSTASTGTTSVSPTPSSTCDSSNTMDQQQHHPEYSNRSSAVLIQGTRMKLSFGEKFKFYKKFYFLPVNIIVHLIICLIILFTKIMLRKQSIEAQLVNANMTITTLGANNTLLVSTLQQNSTTRTFFTLTDLKVLIYKNQLTLNIDYINYFLALFMLLVKFTRVYIKLNFFFTVILIINLFAYLTQNLLTILTIDYLLVSPITTPASVIAPVPSNFFLLLRAVVSNVFQNRLVLLVTYILSWILNLVYYTAFNIYIIHYYNKAQLKLISKYKYYLNRYYNLPLLSVPAATSSSSSSCGGGRESATPSILNHVRLSSTYIFTQYKAIIFGILILLLLELLQIPYLYNCYMNYNKNLAYLVALLVQLVYLLLNAFIWIVLTLKQRWRFNFTLQFQILLWHTLFYNHLNTYYKNNNSRDEDTDTASSTKSNSNQNLQVKMLLLRKQQQIPKSFVNVINITNEKLNKIDENSLLVNEETTTTATTQTPTPDYDDGEKNHSECSTATTQLSHNNNNAQQHYHQYQNHQVQYRTKSNQQHSVSSTTNAMTRQQAPQAQCLVYNHPQIVKKISRSNNNRKQQIDNHGGKNIDSSSNYVSAWNEFNVNELRQ